MSLLSVINYLKITLVTLKVCFCALALLSCRKRSCNRVPETERHPLRLQGLHYCEQGAVQSLEPHLNCLTPILLNSYIFLPEYADEC